MKITESRLRCIIKNIILENTSNLSTLSVSSIEEAKKVFMASDGSYIYEGSKPIMHIREAAGYIREVRVEYDVNGDIQYWFIVYQVITPDRQLKAKHYDEKTTWLFNNMGSLHIYSINPNTGQVAPMNLGALDHLRH